AGKTALAEALLARAGVEIPRGGILDTDDEERARGRSLGLATATMTWRDQRLALLDAPGGAEAIGDAYGAMPAADAALFVIDASVGLGPQHDELWEATGEGGLPRLAVLNQLDKAQARFQDRIDALREQVGKAIAPIHMPLGIGEDFGGVIDLLSRRAVRRVDGQRYEGEIPEEYVEQAERNREWLVEAIVENDDELLMRYLEGETPTYEELSAVLASGVASGSFCPVMCASAAEGRGLKMLADALVDLVPSLVEQPPGDLDADRVGSGPPAAYVAKTIADPYVGRISVLRVLAGELTPDSQLVVDRTGQTARLRGLVGLSGREQSSLERATAGDVVGCTKLEDVVTGDVLYAAGAPVSLEVPRPPRGHYRVVVRAAGGSEDDKLPGALARVAEEDPSLDISRDDSGRQLVLSTYGPEHVAVVAAKIKRTFGVEVETGPVPIAYRETVRGEGRGLGRHVKQSGGHGQYGIAELIVSPRPRGEGTEFSDEIVGGVIPRQFIPSVEKGVDEAMGKGVLGGYPVVDVKVRLVDGKHHSVDSSDVAFQTAGSLGFRAAAQDAGIVLLEPMTEVKVTVPESQVGDVMGDLSARRGRIVGTESGGQGRSIVTAVVPESETANLVPELRALTSGAARVEMAPAGYSDTPEHIAREVVAQQEE
ncbi:MAG: elongation factor G, partial [Egibacteraceae bacterium]